MEFKINLQEVREEARDTKTFVFNKPSGFDYIAGQYVYLTLPHLDAPDARGDTRQFTLSSSPTEENLMVTVRMRSHSAYKHTLSKLPAHAEISMRGPNGTFVLDSDNEKNVQVMLAGGIGITPYRSIIKYLVDKNLGVPIVLVCSNSKPEDISFKAELDKIYKDHEWLKVIYTVSRPEESTIKWTGLTGRIDEQFLRNNLTSHLTLPTSIFWVCGPPAMVTGVEETLKNVGIADGRVKTEKLTGY